MKRIVCLLLLASMLAVTVGCAPGSVNNGATTTEGGETTTPGEASTPEDSETTTPEDSETTTPEETVTTSQEEETTEEPEKEIDPMILKMREDLKGLNVLVLGDSQMAGARDVPNQWCNLLGVECGWNMTNLGISGMTVSLTDKNYNEDGSLHKESMYEYLFLKRQEAVYYWGSRKFTYFDCGELSRKPEDVHVIFLQGGNNDFGPDIAAPLGVWGEKDPGTFMGAWQLVVDRLMEEYPNAIIIFIPPFEYGENERTWYTRNIKTMYDEYQKDEAYSDRIYYIDAGVPSVSGVEILRESWRNEHAYDSFHLKASGMRIMADNLLPYIWEIAKDIQK